MNWDGVDVMADAVMRGVAAAEVVNDANMTSALEIMRAELKELFCGAEYASERECVASGSIHSNVVLGIVVLKCIKKIKEIPHV